VDVQKVAKRIEQKALFAGIRVVYVKENGTSQVCPVCGSKTDHKTGTMNARNVDLGITGMV